MINVSNLNKYYNKRKRNELHVINNTSLELPENGLVTFLGESGSGKTTLLNVIGGLDRFSEGSICYDELDLSKYNMSKADKYRKENISYIFQNYNLIQNISVEENLKRALEIIDIYDKEETNKRIEYVLKAVGLYRYRKKKAYALSGGQQQRVSIARALIKNCKVIIADEPTGNLDSSNSYEIMNILKKISQNTLVLLVTHNKNLAEVYSDTIIEIKDGQIYKIRKPLENASISSNKEENKIYLKDIKETSSESQNLSYKLYDDEDHHLNLTIVYRNGTYYLDSDQPIKLASDAQVELLDEHYEEIKNVDVTNYSYDTSWYENKKTDNTFTNVLRQIKNSLKSFFVARKRTKFFRLSMVLLGVVIGFANYSLVNTEVHIKNYLTDSDAYFLVESSYRSRSQYIESIKDLLDSGDIYTVSNYTAVQIELDTRQSYFEAESTKEFTAYVIPYELLDGYELVLGRRPYTTREVVIGKQLADYLVKILDTTYEKICDSYSLGNYSVVGITSKNTNALYCFETSKQGNVYLATDDHATSIPLSGAVGSLKAEEYTLLVGSQTLNDDQYYEVVDSTKSIEELEDDFNNHLNLDYKYVNDGDGYKAIYGEWILNPYTREYEFRECAGFVSCKNSYISFLVNDAREKYLYNGERPLGSMYTPNCPYIEYIDGQKPSAKDEIGVSYYCDYDIGEKVTIYDHEYKITGKYKLKDEYYSYVDKYCSKHDVVDMTYEGYSYYLYYHYAKYDMSSIMLTVSSKIKNNPKVDKLVSIYNDYDSQRVQEEAWNKESIKIFLVIALVMYAIVAVYDYFSMRAKMISDIYDIGVYRAIGMSRSRIIIKHLIDTFVLITLTSLLGFILFTVIYDIIAVKINSFGANLAVLYKNYRTYLSFALVYIIGLFFGLLPIMGLLRKTPSEIIAKYDI